MARATRAGSRKPGDEARGTKSRSTYSFICPQGAINAYGLCFK